MERLEEIKNKLEENPHVFYGELHYRGLGNMCFETTLPAKDDIVYLVGLIEEQQQIIDDLKNELLEACLGEDL